MASAATRTVMVAAAAMLFVGCGGGGTGVEATEAWARPTPTGATTGAVHLTLRAERDDALVDILVDPDVAAEAMVHETASDEGQMSMNHATRLELPADEDVVFEPGGYHVMLSDLAGPLVVGDSFELTLEFENADAQTVAVAVLDEAP